MPAVSAPDACGWDQLPDDVVENVLLDKLAAEDLGRLCAVSRRFLSLSKAPHLWFALFKSRWGPPGALIRRAAELAGGWKSLYAEKTVHEKGLPSGLARPTKWELSAACEKLYQQRPGEKKLPVACIFLLDGSGSVNEEEFATMTNFVKEATAAIHTSAPESKVGVVQFSNDVRVEYDLAPIEPDALAVATRNMVRMNGGTNVAVAIQKAGQLLKRGAEPDAIRQIVLLTDGRVDSYQSQEARAMADRLADEQRHVTLFAFGVGRGVDKPELLHIIGAPPAVVSVSAAASPATATAAATSPASIPPAAAYPPSPTSSSSTSSSMSTSSSASLAALPSGQLSLSQASSMSLMTLPPGGSGSSVGCCASPPHVGCSLSWLGEDANERYMDLCVREEGPW